MERIKMLDLKLLENDINNITEKKNKYAWVDQNASGVTLHLKDGYGSVVQEVTPGRFTKRELYHLMHAYLRGLRYGK